MSIWDELDKRLNEEPAKPGKRGECVYCPGKKVSGGTSLPSIAARKLGLCAICFVDTDTRRKRRLELKGVEA